MVLRKRMLALLVIDGLLVNLAFLLALLLRFEGEVPDGNMAAYRELAPYFTAVWLGCFYLFGLYRRLWQYASLGELLSIVYSVSLGMVFNIALTYFYMQGSHLPLPRSVFVLAWMAAVMLVGGSRLSWRLFRDKHLQGDRLRVGKPVLIVGAGDAGAAVARELHNHTEGERCVPVGFVDDDRSKHGLEMFGHRVLGGRHDIPRLVENYGIQEIIIAIPSAPGRVIREIVEVCQKTPAKLKILPGIYELINGRVSISQLREVRVEDILGRDPVKVDLESIAGYLRERVVLVTGAGGSIGSELCRQVAQFQPSLLVLLGHGENSIYNIHKELGIAYPDLELVPVIVDARDGPAVRKVFDRYKPGVVFHAAAHKHVPLMECNAAEAVKNNVLGTYSVACAAAAAGTETFVLVSTDKAVNPTSVMGVTKRVSEMIIQHVGQNSSTKFAAVRFGNVLGSRGSVVPLFKEQIAAGGPVTVTHPDMVRYFMTIPEAVQLIIQAGALARGGEVFVLDMGEPVKIVDLAKSMIRLSGFEPGEDIEIVFTGVRPGEKLYEELLTSSEGVSVTKHNRIFIAGVDRPESHVLEWFLSTASQPDWAPGDDEVVHMLRQVVPEFRRQLEIDNYRAAEMEELHSGSKAEVAVARF